ncbi:UNVERIFIED_CONTAM: hypothetical protein FKN15_041024, partial [Acipenser sinensis]
SCYAKQGTVVKMPGARVTGAEGAQHKSGVSEGLVGYAGVTQREEEADDEGEDDLRDGDVLFFVNRGGLPVDEATWERMWRHVSRIHPEGDVIGRKIRGATDLPKIPTPSVPTFQPSTTLPDRLEAIQRYIRDLQYPFLLMDIAKEMIREALPIKCLEAVILGMYPFL